MRCKDAAACPRFTRRGQEETILSAYGAPFHDIVKEPDEGGGNQFGQHIMQRGQLYKAPQEHLVEGEAHDTGTKKEQMCMVCPRPGTLKDEGETEIVVEEDGGGEGERG